MTTVNDIQSVCPICKSKDPKLKYKAREMYYGNRQQFDYLKCPNCEVLYILEPPQNISSFYPENYHCHILEENLSKNIKQKLIVLRDQSTLTGKGTVGQLISKIKPSPLLIRTLANLRLELNSRILDIGCGSADLLKNFRRIGFTNLTGVDPYLPEKLITTTQGFKLKRDVINNIDEKFDVIILNHSLEHMQDQSEILKRIRDLLEPEGMCCIRIPLVGGEAWKLYQTDWFQLDAPRHFFLHSPKSFEILAKFCDFKIEKVVYDSDVKQFLRSEIYKKDISSTEFFEKHDGKLNNFFTQEEIKKYEKLAVESNQMGVGDQASFILSVN